LADEDPTADDHFTIAQTYPRLADLFEDDPNEDYPLPFDDPDDLMAIFTELEEKNLSLIQQGQEHDQTLEKKRKEFKQIKEEMEYSIDKLKSSEKEVKERTVRAVSEKQNLENQTSEGNNKILSEGSYDRIKKTVVAIKSMVTKDQNQNSDPLTMLLEIEKKVDKYIKMFDIAQAADQGLVNKHASFIRLQIRNEKTRKRIMEEETLMVAERARKLQERMNRTIVTGIKKKVPRSEKPATKKKEEKKQDLT